MKSSKATVASWEGFQARSYIDMKGTPFQSKKLCKIDKVLILGQNLLMKHFVTSLPHPHGHSYMKKTYKLQTKTSLSLWVQIEKTVWNDYYNVEGNTFLSIDFPFTSKLKSNCSCLIMLEVNKILPIFRSHLSEIGQKLAVWAFSSWLSKVTVKIVYCNFFA